MKINTKIEEKKVLEKYMKHLCYVYIFDYKCLKNIEITLDCHYKYKYEKDNRILTITKNDDFPSDFWGNNIYSVTGIVGNNGSGKSTVMSFLLDFLVEGSACQSVKGIVVYKNNEDLYYYGDDVTVVYENRKLIMPQTSLGLKNSTWKIPCFYYSGHFSPYINSDSRHSSLSGNYMASDNMFLVEDYQNAYNEDSMHMNQSLLQHLRSFVVQNDYRICMMLANNELSKIIIEFAWPNYVIIGINQSGATAIDNAIRAKNLLSEKLGHEQTNAKRPLFKPIDEDITSLDYYLSLMIYHNLINIIYDRWGWQNGFKVVDEWQASIRNDNTPILAQFSSFINNINNINKDKKNILLALLHMLTQVTELTKYKKGTISNGFLYIDCSKDSSNLVKLGNEVLKSDFYLTSKFFDFSYAQSLDSATILSSGEQELLNLFSRMYDAIVLKPNKFFNLEPPSLLFLDEAEIGFHPDWQRRYLKLVIDFINALNNDFQIIISTHSPILLSDIPRCCTNYLKKEKGSTIKMNSDEIGETFAANVFDLYRMSFFMDNGLVGAFAREKINTLCSRINKGETDGIMNEIQMVGDARIKEYLMEKYHKIHPDDEMLNEDIIKYYEEKIEQLKNKGGVKDE